MPDIQPVFAAAGIVSLLVFVTLLFCILIFVRLSRNLSRSRESYRNLDEHLGRVENAFLGEMALNRQETAAAGRLLREEISKGMKETGDSLLQRLNEQGGFQKGQLETFSRQLLELTRSNEEKIEALRKTVEQQLRSLQEDNSRKLEMMRATVDEKLQATLEARLGESFKQVSDRLEQVFKGLGEMQTLAAGVGDLKKVLTNVKTRGTWGEIQLGNILEQILAPEQYDANVQTRRNSTERVEYAIRLPGQGADSEAVVWLPIDAKFPQEDYQRLLDAQDAADKENAEKSLKQLENRIKLEAKNIHEKYVDPPHTTDFAIMFLPVEGLYAEVLRRPGLCDLLQRKYRVVVTGPTTLAALLNSLQMGFRTLAIEKRSSEVWELLGEVKTEFNKFGGALAKTKKKLQEASNSIDRAEVRTRAIERRLRKVQELPTTEDSEDAMALADAAPEEE